MLQMKDKNLEVSTNMLDNKPSDGKELICINVDKVYDWIVKENSFDISPSGPYSFPGMVPTLDLGNATVTCEVSPAQEYPIVILNRTDRPFCIDGTNVMLQQLNIQKNFVVTIYVTLPGGLKFESDEFPVSRCEQVTLCAPEGTDIEVTYTELHCFVCGTGTMTAGTDEITFSGLTISVSTCQSIQATYPVTVEFLADYCEPRDDLAMTCSPPMRPHPCSAVFPDGGGHGHGCS